MTPSTLLEWAPAFALVLARIGPAMMLLPGLGEAAIFSSLRISLALGLTILLLPTLKSGIPSLPSSGAGFGVMIAGEVFTGVWFGWIARQTALVLPIMAQMAAYMVGLSSVLQPDPELGPQTTALSKLFEMMAPLLFLVTDLYKLPLLALQGLFQLIPLGTMLPAADGMESVIAVAGTTFSFAVQLASPFIVLTIVWHVAVGMVGRLVSRMQIYFVSVPGQVLAGLVTLMIAGAAVIAAWRDGTEALLLKLPGG